MIERGRLPEQAFFCLTVFSFAQSHLPAKAYTKPFESFE